MCKHNYGAILHYVHATLIVLLQDLVGVGQHVAGLLSEPGRMFLYSMVLVILGRLV